MISRSLLFTLLGIALAACEGPLPLDNLPCPCATGWQCCPGAQLCVPQGMTCPPSSNPGPTIMVTPTQVNVPAGQVQSFVADRPVIWQVHEAGGGTIDEHGMYIAPSTPGQYTVIATSQENPINFQLAQVTVANWTLDLYDGQLGGNGDLDGQGPDARFSNPRKVISARHSNINYVADCGNNTIRMLSPNPNSSLDEWIVTTLAGNPPTHLSTDTTSYGSVDGVGPAARFACPSGLALDDFNGILYVADEGSGTIRQLILKTGMVTTIAGADKEPYGQDQDGIGTAARLVNPEGLALDGQGNLYISEEFGTLRRMVLATGEVTTMAGTMFGKPPQDGTGTAANFSEPRGLAWDPSSGLLYIADHEAVRIFDPKTSMVGTLAGTLGMVGFKNDIGTAAQFRSAYDVDLDGAGNLLVTDFDNSMVRSISLATRAVTTLVGSPGGDSADGPLSTAQISGPAGITVPFPDEMIVADAQSAAIRQILLNTTTSTVQTYAGRVITQYPYLYYPEVGDGPIIANRTNDVLTLEGGPSSFDGSVFAAPNSGPPGSSLLLALNRIPSSFVVSKDGGSLYLTQGQAVFVTPVSYPSSTALPTLGALTLIAGDIMQSGTADGVGAAARFAFPDGLALDEKGHLFVADRGNYTVRRIDLGTGQVTTLAGAAGMPGSNDGEGPVARFRDPAALVFVAGDPDLLYLADPTDNTVRTIDPDIGMVLTPLGSAGMPSSVDGMATQARFDQPSALGLDSVGNLYVAEANAVRRVDLRSNTVRTFIGSGFRGVILGSLPGSLNQPAGVAAPGSARLYIVNQAERAILLAHPQ